MTTEQDLNIITAAVQRIRTATQTAPPPPPEPQPEPPSLTLPPAPTGTLTSLGTRRQGALLTFPEAGGLSVRIGDLYPNAGVSVLNFRYEVAGEANSDPLVSPGNGSHLHRFAGDILSDTAPLDRLYGESHRTAPRTAAFRHGHFTDNRAGIAHRPGVWWPAPHNRNTGQIFPAAGGTAINYVRVPKAHKRSDRLHMVPNGAGYVVPPQAVYVRDHGEKYVRINFFGPTWMRRSTYRAGALLTPYENADMWHFGHSRPPWADDDGVALAQFQTYDKSMKKGRNGVGLDGSVPPISWGGPDTQIDPHLDYVGGSSPIGDSTVGNIFLDLYLNRHLTDPGASSWSAVSVKFLP